MTPQPVRRLQAWRRRAASSSLSIGGAAAVIVAGLAALTGQQLPLDRSVDDNTTVFIAPTVLTSPFVPTEPSARFGQELLAVDDGLIAVGKQGLDGATGTVLHFGDNQQAVARDVIFAERTIAASGSTVVVVDSDRFRVLELATDGSLTEVGSYVRSDDATFGESAALSGTTLAVTRSSGVDGTALVEVFDVTNGAAPLVALAPGLDRLSVAIDSAGSVVGVSGVRDRADVGEVQFFRRSGDVWLADVHIDAVGGGAIVASTTSPSAFVVQRNGYFVQSAGVWTMVAPGADGILAAGPELPVHAATVAYGEGLVAFGLPDDEKVLTFTTDGTTLRHAQSLTAPIPLDEDGVATRKTPAPSSFGSAVAFHDGVLVVSGPGAEIEGVDDEGEIFTFTSTLGPTGCTITGTDGDDTLNGTTGDDVICGLGGDDLIRGNLGFDRIYGGPGDDTLNGDADDDHIVGGVGVDRLNGGAGNDWLQGGDDYDGLYGGAGNDRLDGGGARDACYGGADIDTFNDC